MVESCRHTKLYANISIITYDEPVCNRFSYFYEKFFEGVSNMKQYDVGIIGATGMVGQRFATLLENHPWFNVKVLAASPRSAGGAYEQAAGSRWKMAVPMPEAMKNMVLLDATSDIEKIAGMVDFCFCAVDMKKDEIKALEEAYAKAECPIVSNNSAHRFTPDVPMVVPQINPDHIEIIKAQRERLGTKERIHRS